MYLSSVPAHACRLSPTPSEFYNRDGFGLLGRFGRSYPAVMAIDCCPANKITFTD